MRLKINAKPPRVDGHALAGGSSPDRAIVDSIVQNSKSEERVPIVPVWNTWLDWNWDWH